MSQTDEVKIVFTPSGRQGQVAKGTNLLQAARQLGVDVDSVCGGRAMCGRCQVNVGEGSFAKHGIDSTSANLSEPSASEARYAEKRNLSPTDALHANVASKVIWSLTYLLKVRCTTSLCVRQLTIALSH